MRPRDRNNYITSYIVRLKQTATNSIREVTVQSPLRITIGNLTGNTLYAVDVIAISVFNNETLLSNESSIDFTTETGRKCLLRILIHTYYGSPVSQ